MHVVHPHLPRAVLVTLAAALATILVMLLLAARLGDVQLGQSQVSSPAHPAVAPAAAKQAAWQGTPAPVRSRLWFTNPFTPLAPDPVVPRWTPADAR